VANVNTTIFVVDDDDSVRNSLQRLLKSAGYLVEAFASADSFLSVLPRGGRGCIVIDEHMAGMSGTELHSLLVTQRRDLGVIIITAYENAQLRQKAMDAGAIAFFRKPFDDRVFLQAVWRALGPDADSSDESTPAP
jgi:two-component system, LuxR family, response regulator FixJ